MKSTLVLIKARIKTIGDGTFCSIQCKHYDQRADDGVCTLFERWLKHDGERFKRCNDCLKAQKYTLMM